MKQQNPLTKTLSAVLSGRLSIIIYIALFFYLVIFPAISLIPGCEFLMPTTAAMLIGGNYTNVLSALGASISAGAGVAVAAHIHKLHASHKQLTKSIADLHVKIDNLNNKQGVTKSIDDLHVSSEETE
jgi:hypothetical protein